MPADIAACGSIGVARETTPGTYVAPTKFFPIMNESLTWAPQQSQRRGIRKTADILGVIPSTFTVAGDIEMEAFEEILPYFLMAARTNAVKTGATNYTYEFVGANCGGLGTLGKTLSITIVRNGQVFGYTGCVVGGFKFGVDNGLSTMEATIVARNEATQTLPTDTWPATAPFGMGQYSVEFPTGSPVVDTDTFEFSVDDNPSAEFRLKSTSRGADFVRFGERTAKFQVGRDFITRADYDNFRAQTTASVTLTMTKGTNNSVSVLMPVAVPAEYPVNLGNQGDLVRATIPYNLLANASGWAYQITAKTQENLV